MEESTIVGGHAEALFEMFRVLGTSIPGFFLEFSDAGVGALDMSTQFAQFNGVVTSSSRPSIGEIAAWAEPFRDSVRPWSIQLRASPTAEATALAETFGLEMTHLEPVMVLAMDSWASSRAVGPSPSEVVRISGHDSLEYEHVLTLGSGAPQGSLASLANRALLENRNVQGYMAYVGSKAVATGMTTLTGTTLGILNMATLPGQRRQGHARKVLIRMLLDGIKAGATHAILQSSEAGSALYQAVGFRTVETWTYLMRPV